MRNYHILFLIVSLLAPGILSSPLPSFEDIERRWIKGESEAQIHANHHIREASPAWLVDRSADIAGDDEFSYATDRRTLESRKLNSLVEKREAAGMWGAMKKFVNDFMEKEKGEKLVSKRFEDDEAPVLKPKKTMRYYFSA